MSQKTFGTFKGVFIPSFEALLGAVVFLLLPNLTSTFGLLPMLGIIILAHLVSFSTAFSINDCAASVGRVGQGGMYSLTKTSLNSAFGGSIGIQLYLGQAVSIGFYSMGFALSILSVLRNFDGYQSFAAGYGWDLVTQQQIIASGIILISFLLAIVGADFTNKVQIGIFIIMILTILGVALSYFFQPTYQDRAIYTQSPFLFNPNSPLSFWTGLTIFFPAVTGFDAGVGMSGLLKNPRRSLSVGTFSSILVTFLIYLAVAVVYSFLRAEFLSFDAQAYNPLNLMDLFNSNLLLYIILLGGVLAATSSSAIAFFISAPQTLQAIVKDGVVPKFLDFLGKDFSKNGREPRFAVLATFAISLATVWSGNLAFISRLVGIAYLMIYGWINFAAFMERISGNPSFRPNRLGHWTINLAGFILSLVLISLDNLPMGIGLLAFQMILLWALSRKTAANTFEGVWWGFVFRILSWALQRIQNISQGTKNWRPVLGVFTLEDPLPDTQATVAMGKLIGEKVGVVNYFLLRSREGDSSVPFPEAFQIPTSLKLSGVINVLARTGLASHLEYNTILLPFDSRFDMIELFEELMVKNKNVLILKNSPLTTNHLHPRIDIWWRGFKNGSLMAILAHMMTRSPKSPYQQIRVLRTLTTGESDQQARRELEELLDMARIEGEICVIETKGATFQETLRQHSTNSGLIILGMPGHYTNPLSRFTKWDKHKFEKDIRAYEGLPPILFVKSAGKYSLLDD